MTLKDMDDLSRSHRYALRKKERDRQQELGPQQLDCRCEGEVYTFDGNRCAKCSKRLRSR